MSTDACPHEGPEVVVTRPTRLDPEHPLYAAGLEGWREHGECSLCGAPIYREIAGGRGTPWRQDAELGDGD